MSRLLNLLERVRRVVCSLVSTLDAEVKVRARSALEPRARDGAHIACQSIEDHLRGGHFDTKQYIANARHR